MMHLLAGGSVLLLGELFSISCKHNSKTRAMWHVPFMSDHLIGGLGTVLRMKLTNVNVGLRTRLDPCRMMSVSKILTFILSHLSGYAVRKTKMWATDREERC